MTGSFVESIVSRVAQKYAFEYNCDVSSILPSTTASRDREAIGLYSRAELLSHFFMSTEFIDISEYDVSFP